MSGKKSKLKRKDFGSWLKLWHYTTDSHFNEISESGIIKMTDIGIDNEEKPAVWLSSNTDWEQTVIKRFRSMDQITEALGRDEMFEFGVIPIRIEIDYSLLKVVNWKQFKKISGMSLNTSHSLETSAIKLRAKPEEWFASFNSIPVNMWKSIDFWNGKEWVPYQLHGENDEEENGDL